MSRYYGMAFTINEEHTDEEQSAALDVIGEMWPIDMGNYGEGTLGGGKSVEDFIFDIAAAVRKMTGKEINFEVVVTYIEQAPTDVFVVDSEYYKKLPVKEEA